MVRPHASNLRELLSDGYVVKGETIPALSKKLGIETEGLLRQVERHNTFALSGFDEEFGKGGNSYERHLGDPNHKPNPCLGSITNPPFFAVKIYPGDLGASIGLVTDANARVLTPDGNPISGLYACGNDMDSMMAGIYPGPGITIGPAMTFAYIAAKHIASRIT